MFKEKITDKIKMKLAYIQQKTTIISFHIEMCNHLVYIQIE